MGSVTRELALKEMAEREGRYELRYNGELVVRRPTRDQCVIEAVERGLVVRWSPDFAGDKAGSGLVDGAEIVAVASDNTPPVATATRRGNWLQTYTGKQAWPMDMRPEEIDIDDIAHSLAMQCRFAGHCKRFYSVAEHSVHVSDWVFEHYGREAAVWALLHDASEAYLVDVPRPVKPFLAGYKEAEAKVMDAVCKQFGLPAEMPDCAHEADNRILWDEQAQNMAPCAAKWEGEPNPLGVKLEFWSPAFAEAMFKMRYSVLTIEKRIAPRDAERRAA